MKVIECNCVEKIENTFKDVLNAYEAYIAHNHFTIENELTSLPKISLFYRKKNKNGSPSSKLIETAIKPLFCPFCGHAYNLGETK